LRSGNRPGTSQQDSYPGVKGRCPMGCGETLFLGAGGHVTCSFIDCPDPAAVDDWLQSHGGLFLVKHGNDGSAHDVR